MSDEQPTIVSDHEHDFELIVAVHVSYDRVGET